MGLGSGLFQKKRPKIPHLSRGEIADLRKDAKNVFLPMAAIVVEEFNNPLSASLTSILSSIPSSTSAVTIRTIPTAVVSALLATPRRLRFRVQGTTPTQRPAFVRLTGINSLGVRKSETLNPPTGAGTVLGDVPFRSIESIYFPPASGTGALLSLGHSEYIGLSRVPFKRRFFDEDIEGEPNLLKEIANGAVTDRSGRGHIEVTLDSNGLDEFSYYPGTSNTSGSNYCIYYEYAP